MGIINNREIGIGATPGFLMHEIEAPIKNKNYTTTSCP